MEFVKLFEPITINRMQVKNRIVMPSGWVVSRSSPMELSLWRLSFWVFNWSIWDLETVDPHYRSGCLTAVGRPRFHPTGSGWWVVTLPIRRLINP